MGITFDGNNSSYETSRSSYGGRKCACCFRTCFVLLTIEMIFTLVTSFLLAKDFVMYGRHTDILGKDLKLAYIIRDEDINISFIPTVNETVVNKTESPGEVVLLINSFQDMHVDDVVDGDDDELAPEPEYSASESADERPFRNAHPQPLSSINEYVINFANTTVRNFVTDIISDIKNSSLHIDDNKRYYITSMEFEYLSLILYCSSVLYILILVVFVIYFVRNYVC